MKLSERIKVIRSSFALFSGKFKRLNSRFKKYVFFLLEKKTRKNDSSSEILKCFEFVINETPLGETKHKSFQFGRVKMTSNFFLEYLLAFETHRQQHKTSQPTNLCVFIQALFPFGMNECDFSGYENGH